MSDNSNLWFFRNVLTRWISGSSTGQHADRKRPLQFEPLENRRLLTGSSAASTPDAIPDLIVSEDSGSQVFDLAGTSFELVVTLPLGEPLDDGINTSDGVGANAGDDGGPTIETDDPALIPDPVVTIEATTAEEVWKQRIESSADCGCQIDCVLAGDRYEDAGLGVPGSYGQTVIDGSLIISNETMNKGIFNGRRCAAGFNGTVRIWEMQDDDALVRVRDIPAPARNDGHFGDSIITHNGFLGIGSHSTWINAPHDGRFYIYNIEDGTQVDQFNPAPHSAQYFGKLSVITDDVFVVAEDGHWGGWNTETAITAYRYSPDDLSSTQIYREVISSAGNGGSSIGGLAAHGDTIVASFRLETEEETQLVAWRVVTDDSGQAVSLERVDKIVEPAYENASFSESDAKLYGGTVFHYRGPEYYYSDGARGSFQTNGDYIAIGRYRATSDDIVSGDVQLVRLDESGELIHERTITPPCPQEGMRFGFATLFDGDLLFVSAPSEEVHQAGKAGDGAEQESNHRQFHQGLPIQEGTGKVYVYDLSNPDSFESPYSFSPDEIPAGDEFGLYLTGSADRLGVAAGRDALYLYDGSRSEAGELSIPPAADNLSSTEGNGSNTNDEIELSGTEQWDLADDFSKTENPSGAWSYGWIPWLSRTFTHFDRTRVDRGTDTIWYENETAPTSDVRSANFWKNETGADAFGVPPGSVTLHPGPDWEPAVVRWTAPASGTVTVTGSFGAGDIGLADARIQYNDTGRILPNQQPTIYEALDFATDQPFSLTQDVDAGDTIDWVVSGVWSHGNTPLAATVRYDALVSNDNTSTSDGAVDDGTGAADGGPISMTAATDNPELISDLVVTYSSSGTTAALEFTPVADSFGTATITVTAENGGPDNDLATPGDNHTFSHTFDVIVEPVNDDPLLDVITDVAIVEDAQAQIVQLNGLAAGGGESQTLRLTATSGDPELISDPVVTYTGSDTTGSVEFTPLANAFGTATITVTVEDGGLDNDLDTAGDNGTFSQTFDVTVEPVDDPTIPVSDAFSVDDNTELVITAPGILENDIEVDGDELSVVVIDDVSHGTLSLAADGGFSYVPDDNFNRIDQFTYRVDDGTDLSPPVVVRIAVESDFSRYNGVTPNDVNDDGVVAPNDVLLGVNQLNRYGSTDFVQMRPEGEVAAVFDTNPDGHHFFDTNRDGHHSPADVFQVLAQLNSRTRAGEGESSTPLTESVTADNNGLLREVIADSLPSTKLGRPQIPEPVSLDRPSSANPIRPVPVAQGDLYQAIQLNRPIGDWDQYREALDALLAEQDGEHTSDLMDQLIEIIAAQ